jgi:hypothetical protein
MNASAATVLILIALGAQAGIVWVLWAARGKGRQRRFGPEFHRTIALLGNRGPAEDAPRCLERSRARLLTRPLSLAEQDRFAHAWRGDQARFVDRPAAALERAEQLLTDLMRARGYPVNDFEQRTAAVAVDYPAAVQRYRLAHRQYVLSHRGEASAAELRTAMVHYRELFEELLNRQVTQQSEAPQTHWLEKAR